MENKNQTPTISMKIGSITYVVGMHFSEAVKETMEDKLRRLALQEIERGWRDD